MPADNFTRLVALSGAAAGVACFVLLMWPSQRSLAVFLALLVVVVGLGIVQGLP